MTFPPPGKAAEARPIAADEKPAKPPPTDLDACPRCGEVVPNIVWGQTNCPRCGLHFECC